MELRGQLHPPAAFPPVRTEEEGEWVPEPVWKLQRGNKSLALAGYPTTIPPLSIT